MSANEAAMLARLYPSSVQPSPPANTDDQILLGGDAKQVTHPTDESRAVEQNPSELVPKIEVPENVAKLRDNPQTRMYDPAKTFAAEINIESPEVAPEVLAPINVELRRMAGDVGLSSQQVRDFVDITRTVSETPPDEATDEVWRAEASDALSRQYGANAHEALSLARQLVARDPRLGALIETLGIGNHPRIVATIVERAYAERTAGRF